MKRIFLLLGVLLGVLVLLVPGRVSADVNDFVFTSFDADYYLSRDAENRSALRVQETLVAQFPDFDQNHGIERAIPNVYDGHSVSLVIQNVKNANGSDWPYTTYESNDNTVLRIGSADKYVRGEQTFVISYTMRDVTKNFDTGDEFYWDINGTEWAQTFGSVTATVYVDESIASNLDGRTKCFTGAADSTEQDCAITTDGATITARSNGPVAAGENLTVVLGFEPNTFMSYVGFTLPLWAVALFVLGALLLYIALPIWLFMWGLGKWRESGRDQSQVFTIVPQYLPLNGVPILQADIIINVGSRSVAVSATIIDLAVRHYLKIYEAGKNEYELELMKPIDDLPVEDRGVIGLLFGENAYAGNRIAMKDKKNLYSEVSTLGDAAYVAAIQSGYMVDTRSVQKRMSIVGGGLLVLGMFTFNLLLFVAAIVVLVFGSKMPARTKKGVDAKAYLDGTKMYMEVAEEERMKLLQAPDTAAKVDYADKGQLVKLYERLLPYAMLFGIEKEWARQFADMYTLETQPDWYTGNTNMFNAGAFAAAMSSFNTSAQSSFSPPTSSSSSGFSGGGGSSGGGGGGGGGGGW